MRKVQGRGREVREVTTDASFSLAEVEGMC